MHFAPSDSIGSLKSCALAFLMLYNVIAHAQTLKFEHLNTRNGLSHNSVLSIMQDSRGYMWFGTYGGLNKFDGYRITTFKQDGNKNSLKTNGIVAIFEDKDQMLWLGTYGGGVISLDPRTEIFTEYKYLHIDPNGNVVPNVRGIFQDESGLLWFATSEGLCQFDKSTRKFQSFLLPADVHSENNLTTIIQGKNKTRFWLGSYLGLKEFDVASKTFTTFKPDPANENAIAHANVLALFEDKSGTLWIGTEGGGLDAFDPQTKKFTHYRHDPDNSGSISGNVIFSIQPYGDNKIIIATESGLNIVHLSSRTFERITNNPEDHTTLSSNNTRCIFQDEGGVLWIGTDGGGVSRTDTNRKKFTTYHHQPQVPGTLGNNNVFAITEDAKKNIWLGTIEGGLNRFDRVSKTFEYFLPDPKDKKSLSSIKILSLSAGPSGNLWIGTDRDGLCMLPYSDLSGAPKQAKFYRYYKDEGASAINSNVIYAILEGRDSTVWAGTWSRGLNKIEFKKKNRDGSINYDEPLVTHYRRSNDPNSISHDVIFTLFEDRQGTIWVGTVGGGLNKMERATSTQDGTPTEIVTFKHWVNNSDDSTTISDNNVSAIYESRTGDLWLGTSIGLNKMNRANGTFKVFSVREGLPNNVVFGIVEDHQGYLWIATLGGLSKFDPRTETFRNYGFEDGLQDNMFNPHAFCYSSWREMFFGGPNGLTTFYPDSIKDNSYEPKVMLTDFKVFNKSVTIGASGNDRIQESVSTASDIELSYKDYVFSFEFSSSSYANPSKNKYAYRMQGFDPDWVYTDASNRIATYTNLDPGTYQFLVKASNGDGKWSERPATISIRITPPFWQTFWFRFLAVVGFAGLLVLFYRVRVRSIKRQKEELEIIVANRTREIVSQKEEIQSQKESIEEKNVILEQQYHQIEAGRKEIKEKNDKLEEYNQQLEHKVKDRTDQLRKAYNNLAETNKELDQFIYRSAHDLKGPLATIRGLCYLGTLETKDISVISLLKRMENTTGELTSKLSRLMKIHEFNSIELQPVKINYEELIHEIVAELKSATVVHDVQINIEVTPSTVYQTDRRLMKTILKNIIENSIKYKDPEKDLHYVRIEVTPIEEKTQISIRDNGIGIPKEQAGKIFDLFVTATEDSKSFGIGLYEAKLIARRLKGSIRLGKPDSGDTEFIILI